MARGTSRVLSVVDNMEGMATVPDGSVGLVYLDPPFNSGRSFDAMVGSSRQAGGGQHRAVGFSDQWTWCSKTEELARNLTDFVPPAVADLVSSLASSLGHNDLAAYLVMMTPRLGQAHRVLSDTGSLYLHCDPAASHYLKVVLDHLFGQENFRNEIVWKRTHAHSSSRRYGPVHDVILFYSRTPQFHWNAVYSEYQASYLEKHFTHEDENGRYQLITCTAPGDRTGTRAHYEWKGTFPPPGRHWAWKREQMEEFERAGRLVHSSNGVPRMKRYAHDGQGVPVQDLWLDINRLDAHSEERVGYDTQKPAALLERIITASTPPDGVVLDPFCGSGTTLVAAERLGRGWIGMDASLLAGSVSLARVRQEVHAHAVELRGFPGDERAASRLYSSDPLTFGMWGTSILGTLADRKAFNGSVATGTGCLRIGKRRVQVLSWVPVQNRVVGAVPADRNKRLAKFGFVLRIGREHERLRPWLEQRVDARLYEVSVSDLVEEGSLERGLAPQVVRRVSAA